MINTNKQTNVSNPKTFGKKPPLYCAWMGTANGVCCLELDSKLMPTVKSTNTKQANVTPQMCTSTWNVTKRLRLYSHASGSLRLYIIAGTMLPSCPLIPPLCNIVCQTWFCSVLYTASYSTRSISEAESRPCLILLTYSNCVHFV